LGKPYQTEHERVIDWIKSLDLAEIFPGILPEEIVFLLDRGYDNKKVQKAILSTGCHFIVGIKSGRAIMQESKKSSISINELFRNTRKIGKKETIDTTASGRKKRAKQQSARTLHGNLKGVETPVKLVSLVKRNKDRFFLACSDFSLSTEAIVRMYKRRWDIEIFHKDIKSHLGLEDLGLEKFEAIHSHVCLVLIGYLLAKQTAPQDLWGASISKLLSRHRCDQRARIFEGILHLTNRFRAIQSIKKHCFEEKIRKRAA
jgi:hypothetical protein